MIFRLFFKIYTHNNLYLITQISPESWEIKKWYPLVSFAIQQVPNKYPTSIQQVPNKYPTNTQQVSNKYPINCHLPTFYYSEFSSQCECLHILRKTSRQIPTRIKKELCRDKNRGLRECKDVHFPRCLFLRILVFQSLKEVVEGIFQGFND